jgi:hypothetical protein
MSKNDLKYIKKLCTNNSHFDPAIFNKLSKYTTDLFIDHAYTSLFQKFGDQQLARQILTHTGEILSYSHNDQEYTIYNNKKSKLSQQHDSLKRIGITTVKVLNPEDISSYRTEFKRTMRAFPEYKRDVVNPDLDSAGNTLMYVLGGFGALANPGSFHNEFVRKLRLKVKQSVLPLFKSLIDEIHATQETENTKFEMLIDRMMFRHKSQAPSAESWHRDVIPSEKIEDKDEIYGGWINLDSKSQFFSFIPGSHLGISLKTLKDGFATVPKEHVKKISEYKQLFEVPPGHVVIFPQYIIHEVLSKKAENDMMRLFTGWRTTISNTFLHSDTAQRLKNQSIIPLPSGQLPPMYLANHTMFFKNKPFKPIPDQEHKITVESWSRDSIKDDFITDKHIVQRFMTDTGNSSIKYYPEYSKEELKEYLPNKIV